MLSQSELLGICVCMPNSDGAEQQQQQHRAQRQVIVNRDERGYGFSVTGDNPVYVKTVKESMAISSVSHCKIFNISSLASSIWSCIRAISCLC